MMRVFLMFCLLFQVSLSHEVLEYEVSGSVAKPVKVYPRDVIEVPKILIRNGR